MTISSFFCNSILKHIISILIIPTNIFLKTQFYMHVNTNYFKYELALLLDEEMSRRIHYNIEVSSKVSNKFVSLLECTPELIVKGKLFKNKTLITLLPHKITWTT